MTKPFITPNSVEILITNRCNLRCKYCSYYTSPADTVNELSLSQWMKCFGELKRLSVLDVIIQGGEPFCRKDLKEIIQGIVKNRMRYSILTNGTLITEKVAAFLASTNRCNGVQVSIDGSDSPMHDSMRGEGNFIKAIRGLKILQKHKLPAKVRVTIHRKNVMNLEKIAGFLLEDLKLPGFSTNSAMYMGLCRQNSGMVQLTAEEQSLAVKTLLKLNKKYNDRISATAGPLAEGRNWLLMERWRKDARKAVPYRGCLTACGGIFNKIAIRADGTVVPCAQLAHIKLGRVNKDDLLDIWQNHPELTSLRERNKIPLSKFKFCKGCAYVNYCTGNCPSTAYTLLGKVNHPAPEGCLKRFLESGGTLPGKLGLCLKA